MKEFTDKLEQLKIRMDKYIDQLCYSYGWHIRIITDVQIPFPKNYEWVDHDDLIELSAFSWDKLHGWSKPDVQCGDVEIRYLWKRFHPKTGIFKNSYHAGTLKIRLA